MNNTNEVTKKIDSYIFFILNFLPSQNKVIVNVPKRCLCAWGSKVRSESRSLMEGCGGCCHNAVCCCFWDKSPAAFADFIVLTINWLSVAWACS